MPGDLGEVVPKAPALTIGPIDNVETPAFIHRLVWWAYSRLPPGDRDAYALWQLREQDGRREAQRRPQPRQDRAPHKYFPSHPEYFPLIAGQRRCDDREENWQPCTSNPEVVRLAVAAALPLLRALPGRLQLFGSPNDGYGWCMCPKCTALDPPEYRGDALRGKARRILLFANAVAAEVAARRNSRTRRSPFTPTPARSSRPPTSRPTPTSSSCWPITAGAAATSIRSRPTAARPTRSFARCSTVERAFDKLFIREYFTTLAPLDQGLMRIAGADAIARDLPYYQRAGVIGINSESVRDYGIATVELLRGRQVHVGPDHRAAGLFRRFLHQVLRAGGLAHAPLPRGPHRLHAAERAPARPQVPAAVGAGAAAASWTTPRTACPPRPPRRRPRRSPRRQSVGHANIRCLLPRPGGPGPRRRARRDPGLLGQGRVAQGHEHLRIQPLGSLSGRAPPASPRRRPSMPPSRSPAAPPTRPRPPPRHFPVLRGRHVSGFLCRPARRSTPRSSTTASAPVWSRWSTDCSVPTAPSSPTAKSKSRPARRSSSRRPRPGSIRSWPTRAQRHGLGIHSRQRRPPRLGDPFLAREAPALFLRAQVASSSSSLVLEGGGGVETAAIEVFDPAAKPVAAGSTLAKGMLELKIAVPPDARGKVWHLLVKPAEQGIAEDVFLLVDGRLPPELALDASAVLLVPKDKK